LSAVTGVDTVGNVQEDRVVEVTSPKADGRCTGVDVVPVAGIVSWGVRKMRRIGRKDVLVVVGYTEMSSIFSAVGIGVADEGGLPVVVKECVGDGNVVGCVGKLADM
jgi:hypothetical protein